MCGFYEIMQQRLHYSENFLAMQAAQLWGGQRWSVVNLKTHQWTAMMLCAKVYRRRMISVSQLTEITDVHNRA